MDFKNIVETMLKENNKSKAYLAEEMGISPQAIRDRQSINARIRTKPFRMFFICFLLHQHI